MTPKKKRKTTAAVVRDNATQLMTVQEENDSICVWLGWKRVGHAKAPFWTPDKSIIVVGTPRFNDWDGAGLIIVKVLNSGRILNIVQDGEVDIYVEFGPGDGESLCAPTIPAAMRAAALEIIRQEKPPVG